MTFDVTNEQVLTFMTSLALWTAFAFAGMYVIGHVDLGKLFKISSNKAVFCAFVILIVVLLVIRAFR